MTRDIAERQAFRAIFAVKTGLEIGSGGRI